MPQAKKSKISKKPTNKLSVPESKVSKSNKTAKKTAKLNEQLTNKSILFLSTLKNLKNKAPKNLPLVLSIVVLVAALAFAFYKWTILAWVDTTPVTRLALYNQLERRYGQATTEQMIVEALVKNEAAKRRVSLTDTEVDLEYKKFESQFGGEENLKGILSQQGVDAKSFKEQLKLQILIKKMFGQNLTISDQEIKQYVEENQVQIDATTQTASEAAKMKEEITEQLRQQKISQEFRNWLQEAQQSPRVKKL